MYGANWEQVGMDWTALAIELNRAADEGRMFTLIDFDARGRLLCCGYSKAARQAAQAYLDAVAA
jgi:hypothetical protein